MKILVVGSGGREHALVWKIAQSELVKKIFCCPGNAGILKQAECVDIQAEDIEKILDFAKKERIDLTVVGSEVPLALGIVDEFNKYNLRVFGPNKSAAGLEASKIFSKELMAKYNIPSAGFKIFQNPDEAKKHIDKIKTPCVVKADGLAAGKGVFIAKTAEEAKAAVSSMMEDKIFGESGSRIIVEDCLEGEEVSILVFTDSKEIVPLAVSQDYKRIFDNDAGPNTGGMGAYSPAPVVKKDLFRVILENILHRTIDALVREGIEYKGVLYAGIMITKDGPKVLEFNVRFGDPETQAILPRMQSDLLEVMLATAEGRLSRVMKSGSLNWDNRSCVCVVLASGGYPEKYEKEKEIFGLDEVDKMQDVVAFHAGTKRISDKYFTNGGRVLGISGLGSNIAAAIDTTYWAVKKINFEGQHYRTDIGKKALYIK